jgi:single-strand DNA-binding protein
MNDAVTLVGNLTSDPKLSYSSENKTPIARFTVAVNQGFKDTEKTHFTPVTAFGTLAENIADTLRKGQRVVVLARVDSYSKSVEIDGEEKNLTMINFVATAVGPDLRWAVAKVAKVERDDDQPRSSSKSKASNDDEDEEEVPASVKRSTAKSRAKSSDDDEAPRKSAKSKAASDDDEDDDF